MILNVIGICPKNRRDLVDLSSLESLIEGLVIMIVFCSRCRAWLFSSLSLRLAFEAAEKFRCAHFFVSFARVHFHLLHQ